MDQFITCPNCQHKFSITSTLSAQIREHLEKENSVRQKKFLEEIKEKEEQLLLQQKKVQAEQANIEQKVKEQAEKEKQRLWAIAQQEANKKFELKLRSTEEEKQKMTQQLKLAEENELKLIQKAREIEEKERRFEIEKARQLEEERKKIAEDVRKQADEENRLKLAERDKQIEMVSKRAEDLQRQLMQGSMQIQGEVQEEDLKQLLETHFPLDQISDVEKGVRGADLIQTVRNSFGQKCGVIVWESKNTKEWKDEWVKKLKDDQHLVKGDICVLVTKVLPKGVENFTTIHNVWVVDHSAVLLLTSALRAQLQQVNALKVSSVGKDEKMEVLYTYLSGSQFKSRVENIVNAFLSIQEQLATEKRAMTKIWNRREMEIQRIIDQTSGMYGDLQGIIGAALPTVPSLELPGGDDDEDEDEQPKLLE
jgi:hypothetical protein